MRVILLENLRNLGNLGDTVNVKSGYGRNYLIPQGKAVSATDENIAFFEAKRSELEKTAKARLSEAQKRADVLNGLSVTIKAHAGDEGKLFGSVGTSELTTAITQAGETVERREILLPEGPIRVIGDFEIEVQLHPEVIATVNVKVEAEE